MTCDVVLVWLWLHMAVVNVSVCAELHLERRAVDQISKFLLWKKKDGGKQDTDRQKEKKQREGEIRKGTHVCPNASRCWNVASQLFAFLLPFFPHNNGWDYSWSERRNMCVWVCRGRIDEAWWIAELQTLMSTDSRIYARHYFVLHTGSKTLTECQTWVKAAFGE